MIKNLNLTSFPIFFHLSESEIKLLFKCFDFSRKTFQKNEYILLEGDKIEYIGIIVSGIILMEKNDIQGNRSFVSEMISQEIFCDPFMGYSIHNSSVNYKAITDCDILFFDYKKLWVPCLSNCSCHSIFAENLMNLLAKKTRSMMAKIEILSKNTIRDKFITLLSILQTQDDIIGFHTNYFSHKFSNNTIFIPLNRTELADYLCVNRSALVRELKKMKEEKIIDYNKNFFILL